MHSPSFLSCTASIIISPSSALQIILHLTPISSSLSLFYFPPLFYFPSLLLSSVVLFDLLVNILGHNLAEPAYEAEVAQLEYKLVAGEHGLVIKVKGFNHKLPVSEWKAQMDTIYLTLISKQSFW